MKNLAAFDIIQKVVSFETGGWENTKKGVYRIRDNYVNFWFHFIYPHLSDLYMIRPEEFYDRNIAPGLDAYLSRYFVEVCMEYLGLLGVVGKLPLKIARMGTWVGKEGNIDIIAQPPGKKLQLLSLLSGGEQALTAIALLFAILKLKPAAFCILDEIDTSLDEANVDCFAEYLRKYSEGTQFIIITHRKGAMAVCNSLYGVSMEEKGVSTLVSARLD